MEIVLGADHRGVELKNTLRDWLAGEGHNVLDVGATLVIADDDYPNYALKITSTMLEKPGERLGIGLCGSGAGIAVAAAKVKGIRAALIHDPAIAQAARHDDDINFLALGADYIGLDDAKKVVLAYLTTPFAGAAKYVRRLDKIKAQESQ